MKRPLVIAALSLLSACASTERTAREPAASPDEHGEILAQGKHRIRFTIEDRGWHTYASSPGDSIEANRSYLIRHESDSTEAFTASKTTSESLVAEQCKGLGARARVDPKNTVEGYVSKISSALANTFELPNSFERRWVCIVSVLATSKK